MPRLVEPPAHAVRPRRMASGPRGAALALLAIGACIATAPAASGKTGGVSFSTTATSAASDPSTANSPAATAPPSAPATGAHAAPKIPVTKTVSLSRSQTKSVQRRVKVRPDGVIGTGTRKAIRRYQGRRALMRTGRPNIQTLRAMKLGFAEKIAARLASLDPSVPPVIVDGYTFPVHGQWRFGGSATVFGAGRGHQGNDVFAACGTPVVAASAGTVKVNKTQARAGNYLVLTDTPSGEDQVYMHLKSRSAVAVGTRVEAGTTIGNVGHTGRASGCHLHFELWTAPGWYEGGSAYDPRKALEAWAAAVGTKPTRTAGL